ncbi:MAG: L,D-transpeptidase [Hyphomicrobiaceae bacterium]
MNFVRNLRSIATAVAAVALIATALPSKASAQDLFSFLFGGSGGYNGSSVSFSSKYRPRQIIVSFGDRQLYWINKRGQAIAYPIAVPRQQSRWSGVTHVSQKRRNPGWTPTPQMRRENPKLPAHVPGGHPQNPLGTRALYLGASLYRIHGTDAPWTIGTAVSKGCIRMTNEDAEDLYRRVPTGTKVTVTWKRYKG